ncbi:hypothetical protein [Xanthomonas sp. 60]
MTVPTITITPAGFAAIINAEHTGTAPVRVTQIGLTDKAFSVGSVGAVVPGERKRISTIGGKAVATDTLHVNIRDDSQDTYSLRGFGLYLQDGTLFAVYSQATPIMEKAAAATLLLATDIRFANINATSIDVGDVDFINPPATSSQIGVARFATDEEAVAAVAKDVALTPSGMAAYVSARIGAGAPTALAKTLLATATAALMRVALELGSASTKNAGAGNGLDADLLDGQHGDYYRRWESLTGVPTRFTAAPHTHPISEVDNLQTALNGKAELSGATFTGPVVVNGSSIRVQNWGGTRDSGVLYFGTDDSYIYKAGNRFVFNDVAGKYTATLQTGGQIWTAESFDPEKRLHVDGTAKTARRLVGLGYSPGNTADAPDGSPASGIHATAYTGGSVSTPDADWATVLNVGPMADGSRAFQLGYSWNVEESFSIRVVGNTWRRLWHSGNFNPASKANLVGGNSFAGDQRINGGSLWGSGSAVFGGPVQGAGVSSFSGNLGTQIGQIARGWKDGITRWLDVMESDGSLALYGYDTKGGAPYSLINFKTPVSGGEARVGMNASLVVGGTVSAAQNFQSSSAHVVLGAGGGSVYLRPNGQNSTQGEARLQPDGSLVIVNTVFSGQNFQSSSPSAVIGGNGGLIYLRPHGGGSASGEFRVGADGSVYASNTITTSGGVGAQGPFTSAGGLSSFCGGHVRLNPGTGGQAGYISFHTPDGARRGYIGWANGLRLEYNVESGFTGHYFAGNVVASGGFDFGSSRKLKHIDGEIPYTLDHLRRIPTVTGKYRREYNPDDAQRLFYDAEGLLEVIPEAVNPEGLLFAGEMVASVHLDQMEPLNTHFLQLLDAQVLQSQTEIALMRQQLEAAILRIAALEAR